MTINEILLVIADEFKSTYPDAPRLDSRDNTRLAVTHFAYRLQERFRKLGEKNNG